MNVDPYAYWHLMSRALDKLGRESQALELRERMVAAERGLASHAGYLRERGMARFAVDLLRDALGRAQGADLARLQLELARTLRQRGEVAAALDLAQSAFGSEATPETGLLLLRLAAEAGSAETLRLHAPRVLEVARGEWRRFVDPWPAEALAAAADVALGDGARRASLLERAGRHPWALRELARATKKLGAATADADLDLLAQAAPGAAANLDHLEP